MALATIGALATVGQQVFKLGQGIRQSNRARKLERETVRPTYNTPAGINESVSLNRAQYNQPGIPGQVLEEESLRRGTSDMLSRAGRTASSASMLSQLTAAGAFNESEQRRNLAIAGAKLQQQQLEMLNRSLGIQAQYQDKEFDYNKRQPFEENAAAIASQREASSRNIYGALGSLASTALYGSQLMGGQNTLTDPPATSELGPGTGIDTSPLPQVKFDPYSGIQTLKPGGLQRSTIQNIPGRSNMPTLQNFPSDRFEMRNMYGIPLPVFKPNSNVKR